MKKGQLSNILRQLGLIYVADWIRYYIQRYKNKHINQQFKAEYPNITLPPDYLIYESFQMNYRKYYIGGKEDALFLMEHIQKHISLEHKKILDWGCGPARIIRHLPEIVGNTCSYYGTDYNADSIRWCKKHLSGIHFNQNTLAPQLPYEDNYFDVIYGLSIFTHLSEKAHQTWFAELHRVLKQGGVMLLTTQGDNFKVKLSPKELAAYQQGHLIVRDKVKEGHRTFSAFHPPAYMRKMFAQVEILEFVERKAETWLPQDIWIVKKTNI